MSDNLMNRARALGLHGLIAHWDEIGECDWLTTLIAWEEDERRARSLKRRLADARLGEFKPLADFNWDWPRSCDRMAVEDLMSLDFLNEAANVVLVGPNGVGKSTIAANIAHRAVLEGHTVRFATAASMLGELAAIDSDTLLQRKLRFYARQHLLVIDEVGYLSYSNRHADLLFNIVSSRTQQSSTIVYVIWNMALRGLFRTCPAARFPQPRAVRWAKVGRVRPLQGADSRSGATWANNRAKCAGSDFRAWRDWLKGSSGLRSNRCSGWHTTRLRPTGEDWKISCAGVAVREWWRDVRAATTWRATSSTFASVVDLGASGSSHWTRGQACRTRRFSSASRRFDCSSTFSSNKGFATSTR